MENTNRTSSTVQQRSDYKCSGNTLTCFYEEKSENAPETHSNKTRSLRSSGPQSRRHFICMQDQALWNKDVYIKHLSPKFYEDREI